VSDDVAVRHAVEELGDWATALLCDLVAIPSVTGDEAAAQARYAEALREIGLDVESWCPVLDDVADHPSFSDDGLPLGDRPVVAGRWPVGDGDRPTLVLNGHMDVVPPGDVARWTSDPWTPVVLDGRVRGRGTCDMKGGLTAAALALAALRQLRVEPAVDVAVLSVIGEESGGVGTLAAVARGLAGDAAIILEPTGLDLCPVGAGALSFRLHVHGVAAHGANRLDGVSAIDLFAELAAALRTLEMARHEGFHHPAFPDGFLVAPISVGRVVAGDWPSTVPDTLVAEGRFGVLPGESIVDARADFEAAVARAAAGSSWARVRAPAVEWFEGQFAPAATPLDDPFLLQLADAHARVVGRAPAVRGVPYGSDLRFFTNDAGVPAVLYGPGDVAAAHTVDESISLAEVRTAATVLATLLLSPPSFGGSASSPARP
jgi:acetylornithine deacetylase